MRETLTELQDAALALIGAHGVGDEITGKEVANAIGLRPRSSGKEGADMRSIINALRRKGYPICANGSGYYYPRTRREIETYIESLNGRIEKTREALEGIQAALPEWDARPDVRDVSNQEVIKL